MKNIKAIIVTILLSIVLVSLLIFRYFREDLYEAEDNSLDRGTTEIVLLHWIEIPDKITENFQEEYPEIRIKYYKYHKATYPTAIEDKLLGEQTFDLLGVPLEEYARGCSKGLYADLQAQPFLEAYRTDIRKCVRDKAGDGEFAVALSSSYFGIWYNKTIFSDYQLDVPVTAEELLQVCSVLKSAGERPMIAGGRDAKGILPLTLLDSPQPDGKTRKDIVNILLKDYMGEVWEELTYQQAFQEFKKGRYAMFPAWDTSVQLADSELENIFIPGVFSLPYENADGEIAKPVLLADNLTAVYSKSEKKKEAITFLNYLSRPQVAAQLSEANGWHSSLETAVSPELPYDDEWRPLRNGKIADVSFVLNK